VIVSGGVDKMFCAGANIQMLAGASHHHKVNFCKFTSETRNSIEDATGGSQQAWLAAVNGTAAGGGYELALACDDILLVDDRSSAVSLPEVPMLAVLPGTGGLTRVVDKRHVRRDLADVFATRTEGVKGEQAVEWGLVDAVVPRSGFDDAVRERALALASRSDRPAAGPRDDALLSPHAEAARRVGPHDRRPHRSRQLLRGDAGGAGTRRRPHLHARRNTGGRRRPARGAAAHRRERRRLSDGERHQPAGVALLRPARRTGDGPQPAGQGAAGRRRARA